MLKNKKEKKESEEKKISIDFKAIKLLFAIIFFLFMIFVIAITGTGKKREEVKTEVDKDKIISLFDKIDNNYTLEIQKNVNNYIRNITYYKAKDEIMYEEGDYLYFIYNKKTYKINAFNGKIKKIDDKLDFVDDRFNDMELLKRVFNHCEFEYINEVKVNCKIKYSDYLDEYNSLYKTNIYLDHNSIIEFYIVYYDDGIGKIIVDYTGINEIINFNYDDISYGIRIKDVDSNDFSVLFKKYKDIIKK